MRFFSGLEELGLAIYDLRGGFLNAIDILIGVKTYDC
jgi:hypothetical protein